MMRGVFLSILLIACLIYATAHFHKYMYFWMNLLFILPFSFLSEL